jgi:oligogalacturonide lyase
MPTFLRAVASSLALLSFVPLARAQNLPTSWVDKDTGHRVWRLTNEPSSSGFYFNVNAYTPDGKDMIYNAPDGIHVLNLASKKTRLLVPNPPADASIAPEARFHNGVHAIIVGSKTATVFFQKAEPGDKPGEFIATIYAADVKTGAIKKLVSLPSGAFVATINADETLAAGTMNDGPAIAPPYGQNLPTRPSTKGAPAPGGGTGGNLVQPEGKGEMMERRLASRQPLILFTINLKTGKMTTLLHSTDWVNHLLFSPVDPTLLMYCHEGPWQKVDRIWMIHTDGTHNTLIHKRTMLMEIAGHEFWGLDGKTIWYDWQYPKGEDFFLAGYDLENHRRTAFHMQRNEWSIHFNLTKDLDMFTGDGGDPGQVAKAPDGEWIELFHPQAITGQGALNEPDFWQPGVFHAEHLVNMSHHNYKLEPNVRFSPDKSLVIFTSNMFGPSYVFGVEVKKAADAPAADIHSTPELAAHFNPTNPTTTPNDK